jgi:hypothetical protein
MSKSSGSCKEFHGTLLLFRVEVVILADRGCCGPVDLLHSSALLEAELVAIFEPDVDLGSVIAIISPTHGSGTAEDALSGLKHCRDGIGQLDVMLCAGFLALRGLVFVFESDSLFNTQVQNLAREFPSVVDAKGVLRALCILLRRLT